MGSGRRSCEHGPGWAGGFEACLKIIGFGGFVPVPGSMWREWAHRPSHQWQFNSRATATSRQFSLYQLAHGAAAKPVGLFYRYSIVTIVEKSRRAYRNRFRDFEFLEDQKPGLPDNHDLLALDGAISDFAQTLLCLAD